MFGHADATVMSAKDMARLTVESGNRCCLRGRQIVITIHALTYEWGPAGTAQA